MHTQKQADIGRDKYELIAETIYGVTYYRLSDVAKKFNIKYATLYKRYQRGKRGDDLVKRKEKKGRTPLGLFSILYKQKVPGSPSGGTIKMR